MQNPPSDLLPADVLFRRNQLPEKPDPIKISEKLLYGACH